MKITPPYFLLKQIIKDTTPKKLSQGIDLKKILKNNNKHTKEYVFNLILSLKTKDLKIQKAKSTMDLTIHVIAPKKSYFIFEARMKKWVDGSDFTYYRLIGIKEKAPNKENPE